MTLTAEEDSSCNYDSRAAGPADLGGLLLEGLDDVLRRILWLVQQKVQNEALHQREHLQGRNLTSAAEDDSSVEPFTCIRPNQLSISFRMAKKND